MLKLPPHTYAEPDTQLALLRYRDNTRTWTAVERMRRTRFAHYLAALPALAKLADSPRLAQRNKAHLLAIYASQSKLATGIRDQVRKLSPHQCPYCGKPGRPTQVDHFLPQTAFPEFAFYHKNLVPSCDHCNHTKLATTWDAANGARLFLNPFLDDFLAEPFFHFAIAQDAVHGYRVPLFTLILDPALVPQAADQARCHYHFHELDVVPQASSMIRKRCNTLRAKNRAMVLAHQLTPADLTTELNNLHQAELDTKTPNSWDAITYRSIVRSAPYLNFLCTEPFDPATQ